MENLSGAIAQFFATLSIKIDKAGIDTALKSMKALVESSNELAVKLHVALDTSGIKSQLTKVKEQLNLTVNTATAKEATSSQIRKVKDKVTRGDLIKAADIHTNMVKDVGPNRLENMLNQADHLKNVMAEMDKGTLNLAQDFKGRLIPTSEQLGVSFKKLQGQIELLRTQNLSPKATKNMVSRVQTSSKELESLLPIMGAENAKPMATLANRRLADISALDKAGTKGFEPSKAIFEEVIRKASKTLGDASQGKAQEINRSQYNRTLDRLKEHAAQIKEGLSNLAPSQRSFGARALPQLKANTGVFGKDDQNFISGYEKLLVSQREVAKNNRTINELKKYEHQINRELAKDDASAAIKQSATYSKRIRELKSLISNEEKLLKTMYEKKNGKGSFRPGSEEARKFSLSEPYLNALPRRGPNTGLLEAQSQDLLNRLLLSEVALKERISGVQQRINSSEIGSIENNKALIELQKVQSNLQSVMSSKMAVAGDASVARYRAEEVSIRNQERSLGGFLQRTRTLMTGIRDIANNIFLPFIAFSGAKYISDVAAKVSSLKASLEAITGSTAAGADEFAFLEAEAKRLGVTLGGVGKEYVKLVGSTTLSGIDSKVTRDLFTGVSQSAAVFNLDDQETGRVLTALGQIASKGKVYSEELKYRLAA
jgi:hypothetical protein